jgi:hypothetical protein
MQIGGEPLKTIVVEPLELSASILPPEPEPLRDARVRRAVLPSRQTGEMGFFNNHAGLEYAFWNCTFLSE